MEVLLTWVGSRDPDWANQRSGRREIGPILSLLNSRRFDIVYLLHTVSSTVDDFRIRATGVQRYCQRRWPQLQVRQRPLELIGVTDYDEVFHVTSDACRKILNEDRRSFGADACHYCVYLSPGTPQMQTVWIILVRAGLLPARLLDATPPDLLPPGRQPWREVDLALPALAHIVSTSDEQSELLALRAQNRNVRDQNAVLQAQVQRLELELTAARSDGASQSAVIEPGFDLRRHLEEQERLYYLRALAQAGYNAAAAARLLNVAPASLRARVATLGLRPRRSRDGKTSLQ